MFRSTVRPNSGDPRDTAVMPRPRAGPKPKWTPQSETNKPPTKLQQHKTVSELEASYEKRKRCWQKDLQKKGSRISELESEVKRLTAEANRKDGDARTMETAFKMAVQANGTNATQMMLDANEFLHKRTTEKLEVQLARANDEMGKLFALLEVAQSTTKVTLETNGRFKLLLRELTTDCQKKEDELLTLHEQSEKERANSAKVQASFEEMCALQEPVLAQLKATQDQLSSTQAHYSKSQITYAQGLNANRDLKQRLALANDRVKQLTERDETHAGALDDMRTLCEAVESDHEKRYKELDTKYQNLKNALQKHKTARSGGTQAKPAPMALSATLEAESKPRPRSTTPSRNKSGDGRGKNTVARVPDFPPPTGAALDVGMADVGNPQKRKDSERISLCTELWEITQDNLDRKEHEDRVKRRKQMERTPIHPTEMAFLEDDDDDE